MVGVSVFDVTARVGEQHHVFDTSEVLDIFLVIVVKLGLC